MKTTLFAAALLFTTLGFTQSESKILGIWLNADKDAKIRVYKEEGKYYGKIVWILNNENEDGSKPKTDQKNPDPALRSRPTIGIILLKELVWDGEEYDDGYIYDPKSGKTYDCYARLESDDELFIKGYIGFSLIGRSTIWTRSTL